MNRGWRPEDEALLVRLEDEAIFERVWRDLAGPGVALPHPRAAGVLASLRETDVGPGVLERAAVGDTAPLIAALHQPPSAGPRLAHHLALLHGRLADVLERSDDTVRRASAEQSRLRSLGHWLALAVDADYLREMGDAVVGASLPAHDIQKAATDAPFGPIVRLGRAAKAGARELSEPARLALRVLARMSHACDAAGAGDELRRKAEGRARRERETAIDAAIARVDAAIEEAFVRDAPTSEIVSLLWDGVAVWRWSDKDEQVERFMVQRITPALWQRYHARRWDDVRALLHPLEEPIEHLARLIETDPKKLAYAAPCAQMYVFRAEVAPSFEAQLALCERAVALCSTHRNGRLILADLLIERALRAVDTAMPWATGDALARAAADVKRAEDLYPTLKRLPDAKQRLKAKGRDVDA